VPKVAKELTHIHVKRLGEGRHAVGGVSGLILQVSDTGARSWILRTVTKEGVRRWIGLGSYEHTTLAVARDLARAVKASTDDPVLVRRKAREDGNARAAEIAMNVEACVRAFHIEKRSEFKNEKAARSWLSAFEAHCFPALGDVPVSRLTLPQVVDALKPIWLTKPEAARKLRTRLAMVLDWCVLLGHRVGDNPARAALGALPDQSKSLTVVNQPALSLDDAPHWWRALLTMEGQGALALQFAALTAARSGEVRGAVWSEIDLDDGLWSIPETRMKAKKPHRVPLSDSAVTLLRSLPRHEGTDLIFPSSKLTPISDMTLSATMRRMSVARDGGWIDAKSGRPAVPHGLRSTFRDWVSERTSYETDLAEAALAHATGSGVERAYRRGDALEKRRAMMQDWAAFLAGQKLCAV
jgi:integrase